MEFYSNNLPELTIKYGDQKKVIGKGGIKKKRVTQDDIDKDNYDDDDEDNQTPMVHPGSTEANFTVGGEVKGLWLSMPLPTSDSSEPSNVNQNSSESSNVNHPQEPSQGQTPPHQYHHQNQNSSKEPS